MAPHVSGEPKYLDQHPGGGSSMGCDLVGRPLRLLRMALEPGCLAVATAFIIQMFTTSVIPVSGVYQNYYLNVMFPHESAAKVSWIATASQISLYGTIAASGILYERAGPRLACLVGLAVMFAGYVAASFGTAVWHFAICQGLVVGVGGSFLNGVTLVLPMEYFERRKNLAVGVAASGTGIGGLWLSVLTQYLLTRYGIRWTLRIVGLMTLGACAPCIYFQRRNGSKTREAGDIPALEAGPAGEPCPASPYSHSSRHWEEALVVRSSETAAYNDEEFTRDNAVLPPSLALGSADIHDCSAENERGGTTAIRDQSDWRTRPVLNWSILLDPPLWLLFTTMVFASVGTNGAAMYAVSSATHFQISDIRASALGSITSGAHTLGNILAGCLGDHVGANSILLSSLLCCSVFVFAIWYPARLYGAFVAFSLLFGLVGLNYNIAVPVLVRQLYGMQRAPSTTGVVWLSVVVGGVCGSVGMAAVYDKADHRGRFRWTILATGICFSMSFVFGLVFAGMFWRKSRRGLLADGSA